MAEFTHKSAWVAELGEDEMKKKKGKKKGWSNRGVLRQAKKDNFNRDRSAKTPDEFADGILKDMKLEDIYSVAASYYDVGLDGANRE